MFFIVQGHVALVNGRLSLTWIAHPNALAHRRTIHDLLPQALELADPDVVTAYVDDLKRLLDQGSIMEQKEFLRSFVKGVEVGESDLRLLYTIPMPTGSRGRGLTEEVAVLPIVQNGSPCRIKDRTFLSAFDLPRRQVEPTPPKLYPNPMVLAQTWQNQIQTGQVKSRADLARQLGVSRAHVTQVLRLLGLTPRVQQAVLELGDPIEGRIVGAHTLRSLVGLPAEDQTRLVSRIIEPGSG